MVERPDFLRHIVNPLLAKYSRERRELASVLNEVRKLVASAEDKYGFSSFGGNPSKLSEYLRSRDFDLVISVLKTANATDIVKEILSTVEEKYSDLADVVASARERKKSLGHYASSAAHTSRELMDLVGYIVRDVGGRIITRGNEITVERDRLKIAVVGQDKTLRLTVTITLDKNASALEKISTIVKRLVEILREKA